MTHPVGMHVPWLVVRAISVVTGTSNARSAHVIGTVCTVGKTPIGLYVLYSLITARAQEPIRMSMRHRRRAESADQRSYDGDARAGERRDRMPVTYSQRRTKRKL